MQLANGFQDSSALFRHEIAYIFGQMQHEASVPSLVATLSRDGECDMVRHECAEALGSVASDECLETLKSYLKDQDQVVRESCEIGLDMLEYERSGELQYTM